MVQSSNRDFLEEVFLNISAKVDQNHRDLIAEIVDLKGCLNTRFSELEGKITKHETYFTLLGGLVTFLVASGYLIPLITSIFPHK